jgi:RNA polymerase sigma-70 factor, ECF subfamily
LVTLTVETQVSDDWSDQEPALIQEARRSAVAFSPLYEHYFTRIYRYCWRRVRDHQEAEDLTSLIFIRALSKLPTYHGGSFAAWLFQIAHNTVANHLRDRRAQVPLEQAERIEATSFLPEHSPDDDDLACVARLIAALPEDQRELLALRIAGELSAKEIGVVLGKNEGAVRVALHRIIQQLRTAYEQEQKE